MFRRLSERFAAGALPTALACFLLSPAIAQEATESAADAPAEASTGDDAQEAEEAKQLPERAPLKTEGSFPREWVDAHRWRSIGPTNMGGRCTDIAVNPDNRSEYWISTAGGGVLHTTNNGVSYEHQFTNQRVSSVGALAVSPSNPLQIWAGTGENNPRNSVSWGDGVYVSSDSGATWRYAGLGESFQISTIVVHPQNPDIVYVGAVGRLWGPNDERGLYKTIDGGHNWERIHFVNENTGVIDVKMNPADPDTIVIATYERRRDMFDTNDPAVKWGDGSAIWRTIDGGETWDEVTEGLPTVQLGRIGLSWSASQPDNVFAVVETNQITQQPDNAAWFGVSFENADLGARVRSVEEKSPGETAGLKEGDVILRIAETAILDRSKLTRALRNYFAGDTAKIEAVRDGEIVELEITFDKEPAEEEENFDIHGRRRDGPFGIGLGGQRANAQDEQGPEGFQFGGVFKSEDRGVTWTRINSLNPRPMYYSEIRVDPSDENHIFVCGTRLHKSSDGGATFTSNGHGGDVHVDHHALWVDPANGSHLILGNDGGIYVTYDRMENWNHHNRMAMGQFYNVTAGPRMNYMVYGGLQDNGSWGGPSRTSGSGASNHDWFRVGGGDGFRCIVDPTNPDLVYYESQNGGMGRRDFATGEGGFLRPRGGRGDDVRYRFNWNTPFLLSHFNSQIYYSAGNFVFRSVEKGSGQRRISPEITATDRGAAVALAESSMDQDVLYVGTDDGALWMTEDGGKEWTDLMALNGKSAFDGDAETKPDEKERVKATTEMRAKRVSLEVEAPEGSLDGTLAGTWSCKANGEGIENDAEGRFSLTIEVDGHGKVSGTLDSEIGKGAIKRVRWSERDGSLTFRFEGDSLTLEFDAKVDASAGTMTGTIEAAGGAFSFEWSGTRDGSAASTEGETADVEVSEGETAEDKTAADETQEGTEGEDAPKEKGKKKKHIKDTLDQLLPGRRYVSDLKASKFSRKRVYATFDGHRSDDGLPHAYVSEDLGRTWDSIRSNLPDSAGSARAILEDATNENVLYLGCEFGVYVSVDRGGSWTRLNSNLPTVPVHDLAQHTGMRELVAGTHGRSVWILDIGFIGQVTEDVLEADATLLDPADVHLQARGKSYGRTGNHVFTADNPSSGARIGYVLNKRARDISVEVLDVEGKVIATLEADGKKGLHFLDWNLRATSSQRTDQQQGRRRRRGSRRVAPGTYCVRMTVGGNTQIQTFEILNDPAKLTTEWIAFEDEEEELQALFDAVSAESDRD